MTVTIDDITEHRTTAVVLIRGSGFTEAGAAAMRADMDTFLATPVPQALDDLDDVDTTTTPPATGDALVYDGANFVPGDVSGAISAVQGWNWTGGTAEVEITDVATLRASRGLTAVTSADPNTAYITPEYGGPGSKDLIAHSDHTHTTPTTTPATYTSKGTLSSGSVTLVSTNVTLPAAGAGEAAKVYRVRVELYDTERGNGGSSYFTQSITINGNTRTSGQRQCVGGVPASPGFVHSQEITGTGASIAISAALTFASGDPLTVDAGEIVIDVACNR